jgi:hypothetical protein
MAYLSFVENSDSIIARIRRLQLDDGVEPNGAKSDY